MIPEATLRAIVATIRAERELFGCLVAFEGNGRSYVLDPGAFMSPNYPRVMVILEETTGGTVREVRRTSERWNRATIESTANFLAVTMRDQAAIGRLHALVTALERFGSLSETNQLHNMEHDSERCETIRNALEQATRSADGVHAVNQGLRQSRLAATPGWRTSLNPRGPEFDDPSTRPAELVTNNSRFGTEVLSMGGNCAITLLSAYGVVGGVVAEVPTAGASTFLVVVAWMGLASSTLQCMNGIARVVEAVENPDSNSLQQLDDNSYYDAINAFVNLAGAASSAVELGMGARNIWDLLRRRNPALATAEELALMAAAERRAAVQLAVQQTMANPEGRAALMRELIAQGFARSNRVINSSGVITARAANTLRDNVLGLLLSGGGVYLDGRVPVGSHAASWLWVHVVPRDGTHR